MARRPPGDPAHRRQGVVQGLARGVDQAAARPLRPPRHPHATLPPRPRARRRVSLLCLRPRGRRLPQFAARAPRAHPRRGERALRDVWRAVLLRRRPPPAPPRHPPAVDLGSLRLLLDRSRRHVHPVLFGDPVPVRDGRRRHKPPRRQRARPGGRHAEESLPPLHRRAHRAVVHRARARAALSTEEEQEGVRHRRTAAVRTATQLGRSAPPATPPPHPAPPRSTGTPTFGSARRTRGWAPRSSSRSR